MNIRNYLLLVILVISQFDLEGQNIYAFDKQHFVSIDLEDGTRNNLITFDSLFNVAVHSKTACTNRFNGNYYYVGTLPNHSGQFHIIDLIDLSISSFDFQLDAGELVYNWIRNEIIYTVNGSIYSLNLSNLESRYITETPSDGNNLALNQKSVFVPQFNEFFIVELINTNLDEPQMHLINCDTGNFNCRSSIELYENFYHVPQGVVCNNYNGNIYSHKNGLIGLVNPCLGETLKTINIPEYISSLVGSMSVFNHKNNTYIVPYISVNSMDKIAIVDIENMEIVKTLELDSDFYKRLYNHQIYDKPEAPIVCLNDTLFVPKGEKHQWYLDGQLIGTTESNYWVPEEIGNYKAYIDFREYSTFSKIKEVGISSIEKLDVAKGFNLILNLDEKNLFIELKEVDDFNLHLIDMNGKTLFSNYYNQMKFVIIGIEDLTPGNYVAVFSKKGSKGSKQFIIPK